MELAIYVFAGLFVLASLGFSVTYLRGAVTDDNGKRLKFPMSFAFFAWKSIETYLEPAYWTTGKLFMLIREGSFVLIVVLMVFQYLR